MNVVTSNPIYYSSAEGGAKMSATEIAGIATAGVGAAAAITSALSNRPKSDVKQACGRKPLFGKDKKAKWQKCSDNVTQPRKQVATTINKMPTKRKSNNNNKIIIASVVGVALLLTAIVIIKNKKK